MQRLAIEVVSGRNLVTSLLSLKDIIHLLLEGLYSFNLRVGQSYSSMYGYFDLYFFIGYKGN